MGEAFGGGKANDKISIVVLWASKHFRNTYTFVSQKLIFQDFGLQQ